MNNTMKRIADTVRRCLKGENTHMKTPLYSVCRDGESIEVCYRGTCVAQIVGPDVLLRAWGWRTVTTKRVMNAALWGAGTHAYVYQKAWEWYVSTPNEPDREYEEGMGVQR